MAEDVSAVENTGYLFVFTPKKVMHKLKLWGKACFSCTRETPDGRPFYKVKKPLAKPLNLSI